MMGTSTLVEIFVSLILVKVVLNLAILIEIKFNL